MFKRNIREISLQLSPYCNLECGYCFCSQNQEYKLSPGVFNRYKDLIEFTKTLPLGNSLVFNLIGGESSLICDEMETAYKNLSKLKRSISVDILFGTFTNGTNLEGIIDLMDRNILNPYSCNFSWDGIYSSSKSRIPKDKSQDDEFFNNKIKLLGNSKFKDKMLIRTALTPNTIDNMVESVSFLLEAGCTKWEYYFLTDCDDYRNTEFIEKFKCQLKEIIQLYKKYNFEFYNLERMCYSENVIPENMKYKIKFIGCGNLGEVLHISRDGKIYPCGFFSDDCKYSDTGTLYFGDIKYKFDIDLMNKFIVYYSNQKVCDYQHCDNLQCFECPGFVKYRDGDTLKYKATQVCNLRTAEREVFLNNYNIKSHNSYNETYTSNDNWKIVGLQQR